MLLSDLFKNAPNITINQLSCDSRLPMMDCIFFCVKGIKYNGHEFIKEAINNGAKVIVYSDEIDTNLNAIFIKVNNVIETLIKISNKFYDYNSLKLESYVVSGCYGRSSITSIIKQLLSNFTKCGSIGVFGINYFNEHLLSNQPTLTILDNQKYISEIVKNGCKACTFEADALSLSYNKLDMLKPACFIYTNTYLNCSDYKEMNINYIDAIKKYLYTLDDSTYVILNRDDISYDELFKASGLNKVSYGFNEDSDFVIFDVIQEKDKTTFKINYHKHIYSISTSLLGFNNIYNTTAAFASLFVKGYDPVQIIEYCKDLKQVDGVIQRVDTDRFNIYIDCAHNFECYKNVFKFGKTITDKNNKIISVISLNSSDNEYQMTNLANIAKEYSDLVIITTGDYKNDVLDKYMNDFSELLGNTSNVIIDNRILAINEAIELLNTDDTLFVFGKGNEKFLITPMQRYSYDGDYNTVINYLND